MSNATTARNSPVKLLDSTPAAEFPAAAAPADHAASPDGKTLAARRKRLFMILAAAIVVAALATLTWFWITAGQVTTDNAYVDADVAQVTPLYGGPVAAAYVTNTDVVKKGQVLLVLDSADARL